MRFKFHFKQVDVSKSLQQFTVDQMEKLNPYLLKESSCTVHFSHSRYQWKVEILVNNPEGLFKAQAVSEESLYAAVDKVADKLGKQFLKVKEKAQYHKKFDRTKEAKMLRLNTRLEYENRPVSKRKVA